MLTQEESRACLNASPYTSNVQSLPLTARCTLPSTVLLLAKYVFLSSSACGGNNELSGSDAQKEGLEEIDKAIVIFAEFKDDAHLAEALMTKGCCGRG